ncbi:SCO family protein [Thalassomonas actiniarum]|uniref:SCO family protein n=1 Tax=Thalassomonas actiniarum TaxID=485447 RepID=A0AAF0C659_9GAMM|nr:SCO family protein [Thalassomonas actiniarum]WDE01650.1 SCO family protein [Thalassomonas actiniarum]
MQQHTEYQSYISSSTPEAVWLSLMLAMAFALCSLDSSAATLPENIKVNHLAPQEGKVTKKLQQQLDHSQHLAQMNRAEEEAEITAKPLVFIPNITLTNELGQEVALMDDVIKDKIVVINTIYTRCTTVCPVMGVQYTRLQHMLKRRFGKEKVLRDVLLLSVSIDPVNDEPNQLRAFKNKFKGGPGWTLLTGSRANIDKLLKATGLFTPDLQEHTPITLVGRVSQNSWTRLSGLGSPRPIAKLVDTLINSPPPLAASHIDSPKDLSPQQ